jgi:cytochrome c-type biogenesis protein CcmH/NrfG
MNTAPHLAADLAAGYRHYQAGQLDEAETLLRMALFEAPGSVEAIHLLGLVARARNDFERAVDLMRRADGMVPNMVRLRCGLADTLTGAGLFHEAADVFRHALTLDPFLADAWFGLGRVLSILGQPKDAIDALHRAIDLDPTLTSARLALVAAGDTDQIDPLLRTLDQVDLRDDMRIATQFALATALDAAGRYDEAFSQVRAANQQRQPALVAAGHGFDAEELRSYVDRRIAVCSADYFARAIGQGSMSEKPVFVVGMPRSGTTLVEQILASHSQVIGFGESNRVADLVSRLDQSARSDRYGDWEPQTLTAVAEDYVAQLPDHDGAVRRVIDKTPDNLWHLAAIARLFPNARVIVCHRDPRDTCLSCLFQNFERPMPYSNDLMHCAQRVQEVGRLLDHWRSVLPIPVLEVHYEALVSDPDTEIRRLIAFVGLEWEPACLKFQDSGATVTSPSVWQVRRPLYTNSIGRWQHYQRHIAPLLDLFGRD